MEVKGVICLLTVLAYAHGEVEMKRGDNATTSNESTMQRNASDILPKKYIYGGEDAEAGAYPWMVHLKTVLVTRRMSGISISITKCGGSLISDRHVLTAAHCIERDHMKQYHNLEIYLGEYDTDRDSYPKDCAEGKCVFNRLVYPDKIILHPHYNSGNNGNSDIALLRLEKRIHFTPSIQPIPLVPFDVDTPKFTDHPIVIIGWGVINKRGEEPKILQATEMRLMSKSICRQMLLPPITGSAFCIRSEDKSIKNPCKGDSGGPAVIYYRNKYYLAGVSSMAPTCGGFGVSSYTNVFRHMKWIKSHMNRV